MIMFLPLSRAVGVSRAESTHLYLTLPDGKRHQLQYTRRERSGGRWFLTAAPSVYRSRTDYAPLIESLCSLQTMPA